ncbi:ankyrin repeat domain-containing protein [Aeromicrobium ginsengisoli]|uniref:Ankyrin repeat domain-containing protein n=1 Tax=Aeromicrobium ginsengisoli TaxID=363867 RepID=A0A5M4FH21_9ACTN|nr:ankyrin repeat domain-containing protein [Aeromicrobium ginsengisoli]KAA1399466.1 ankyrin repeat domain-containing protein [Aeromicrobium ginsengisoli]
MFKKRASSEPEAEAPDREGRSKLHYAALENDAVEVRRCLSAGEDVNAVDRQGFTPMHFAAQQLAVDALRELAEADPDVTLANTFGNTALWTAVFAANASPQLGGEVVRLLISLGADPDHVNHAGKSPRDMAETLGRDEVLEHMQ